MFLASDRAHITVGMVGRKRGIVMQGGQGGMGSHKHGISGIPTHSPRYRHFMKREAELNDKKDRSRIMNPVNNVSELFKKKEK